MKLSRNILKEIILEVLSEEEPPQKQSSDDSSKELKIDIPDSPFTPDTSQILDQLKNILKQWQIKNYPSDEIRWKEYYKDIAKLFNQIKGEVDV